IRSMSSCLLFTRISRSMLRVILLNNTSTKFSQEPCLGQRRTEIVWVESPDNVGFLGRCGPSGCLRLNAGLPPQGRWHQLGEKTNEVAAFVAIAHDFAHPPAMQV